VLLSLWITSKKDFSGVRSRPAKKHMEKIKTLFQTCRWTRFHPRLTEFGSRRPPRQRRPSCSEAGGLFPARPRGAREHGCGGRSATRQATTGVSAQGRSPCFLQVLVATCLPGGISRWAVNCNAAERPAALAWHASCEESPPVARRPAAVRAGLSL